MCHSPVHRETFCFTRQFACAHLRGGCQGFQHWAKKRHCARVLDFDLHRSSRARTAPLSWLPRSPETAVCVTCSHSALSPTLPCQPLLVSHSGPCPHCARKRLSLIWNGSSHSNNISSISRRNGTTSARIFRTVRGTVISRIARPSSCENRATSVRIVSAGAHGSIHGRP